MNNRNYFPTLYFPSALTSNLESIQALDREEFFFLITFHLWKRTPPAYESTVVLHQTISKYHWFTV